MRKLFLGLIGACLMVASVWASQVALNPDHPDSYVVKKGDTLWDISGMFLRDPWDWPEIWYVNPQIENPHLIFPGDRLRLVYVEGKPQIRVERGAMSNTVKLTPTMRSEPIDNAIPAIPLEKISAFLDSSRFFEPGQLEGKPYVISGGKGHLVTGAGDEIYGRGKFDPDKKRWGIYRKGKVYTDPKTGEILGVQAREIGETKLVRVQGDIATMDVNRSNLEVRIGDYLLPIVSEPIRAEFFPSAPDHNVHGQILDVEGGVTTIGPMNVVMVNLGKREGIKAGNVMAIYKKGENVMDPKTRQWVKLPDVEAGLLMYFRVFGKMSYALVLSVDQPLAVHDSVRMP